MKNSKSLFSYGTKVHRSLAASLKITHLIWRWLTLKLSVIQTNQLNIVYISETVCCLDSLPSFFFVYTGRLREIFQHVTLMQLFDKLLISRFSAKALKTTGTRKSLSAEAWEIFWRTTKVNSCWGLITGLKICRRFRTLFEVFFNLRIVLICCWGLISNWLNVWGSRLRLWFAETWRLGSKKLRADISIGNLRWS